ncbi:hypothetical protein ACO2Q0_01910 [Phenylobacterium sp. VNQ135]|uniref:hypothetical protein n=1 Tax=Phenylobacterium sp. VNQ135 TaxID=3400922 RepID=UPI003C0581F9
MRRGLVLAGALVAAATPALASDPADMAEAAKTYATQAPNTLALPRQGQTQIPNYGEAQFRNVRANYKRFELVNDRIVFCGEVNVKDPATSAFTGWTKFAYLPGDPPILVTPRPGLGLREVGPQVLRNVCETGQETWLDGDFTAFFQKKPGPPV